LQSGYNRRKLAISRQNIYLIRNHKDLNYLYGVETIGLFIYDETFQFQSYICAKSKTSTKFLFKTSDIKQDL
jgi:hypothetical protein